MTSALLPGVYRLTYTDWLTSPEDGLRREILEGELYVTPPPTVKHQRVSREIEFRLLVYLAILCHLLWQGEKPIGVFAVSLV